MVELSVVLPIRLSEDRLDVLDRLALHKIDTKISERVQFIAIDDGSPKEYINIIKKKCNELKIAYIRIDSETECFSVGRARNVAAQSVDTKFLMFQDVDLIPYDGFYEDAINECYVQQLDKFADRFVMFGVVYLTKDASEEYLLTDGKLKKSKFLNYLLENDKSKIEKFSTGTSVTIWRTDHYLCTGGNDPEFAGWGYEDLEYTCRAIRRNRKFPLPNEFSEDYRNFTTIADYKGWKSIYRLYGDLTFNKGIVMFHYWHPINTKGNYQKQKEKNKIIFNKKLLDFAQKNIEAPYLPMKKSGKSLVFRSNPWTTSRWIAPYLGQIIVVSEERFNGHILLEYIRDNNIDRVVFHNPYASNRMLELYNTVKDKQIPFIVCERGALNNSVFFDPNGFNAESSSYDEIHWNKEISKDHLQKTIEYIINEKSTDDSLEKQSGRISRENLYTRLNISLGKKILFVPLQRPSDTVIKYLCGEIESYDNFIKMINIVAKILPSDWEIVVKRHPLEVENPHLDNVIFANDINIKSLVEFSSSVLVINSGVGVLSMLYDKPVLVAGSAFYGHRDITYPVQTASDVINGIEKFKPNKDKTLKFISYLINEFYSFGKFTTKTVPWENGSKMTATTGIEYYAVRFPNMPEMILEKDPISLVSHDSILFDRYKNSDGMVRLGKKVETKKNIMVVSKTENNGMEKEIILEKGNSKGMSVFLRKLKKIRNNPKSFFEDSKKPLINNISKILN